MTAKLPQFEFEKNAENDDLDDNQPAILTAAQIKPFDNNRQDTSMESFNEEFKLEPEAVLSNFNKFLISMKWTKNQPKNFKEWFLSIVDDCFYYYLKMNEPVYAYHLLKISRSFMQNYLYKIEGSDIEEKLYSDQKQFAPESSTIEECLNNLTENSDFVKANYKIYQTNFEFEQQEWQLKSFKNTGSQLEGNKHIMFHKNYALLVFYGLIQFRNYQANNFNILFLAFS